MIKTVGDNIISVEIAFATPATQLLVELDVEAGSTVASALAQSGVFEKFKTAGMAELPVGIWGQLVERDRLVRDGDRIEIYRELEIDPREARRRLAESGRTMSQPTVE